MQNKVITAVTLSLLLTLSATTHAAQLTGCEAKKEEIKTQIKYAKEYGNTHRLAGLETALQKVNEYCTDGSLRVEQKEKIAEKEGKVAEREQELNEAKEKGNTDKIEKKERKLQEAIDELNEAKNELLR
ncbi:DUF1090 domain-containing protein [Photobacterium frigidiphilum]|uniref:DUF1090 domain-containing protein n=1 Tax=Photobacterium frigidiphilum TaxID=264736 RepID=UPI003D0D47F0